MSDHAKFSFSAAHRWMACPGSIVACENIPNTSSWQAEKGTRLHAVAADVLGGTPHDLQGEEAEIVDSYVEYVRELARTPMTHLLVEQRVVLSQDVWGTCDALIVQPYVMHIIDFKTGSQRIDAEHNAQLLGYAAAALNEFNVMPSAVRHEIRPVDIKLHIVQPSIGWYDSWTVSAHDVGAFVKKINAAVAQACSPAPTYSPSEEACKWCPARATCRARAEFNVDLAVAEFALADPPGLSLRDIERILPQVPQIVAWATSIQEYATSMALKGQLPEGYKLVQSGGQRKWRDPGEAISALVEAGIALDMARKVSPIGIGDAEKLLGKKHHIFTDFTARGAVNPTLARSDDKRKEWGGTEDFDKIEE
jgi:hypothetical protein